MGPILLGAAKPVHILTLGDRAPHHQHDRAHRGRGRAGGLSEAAPAARSRSRRLRRSHRAGFPWERRRGSRSRRFPHRPRPRHRTARSRLASLPPRRFSVGATPVAIAALPHRPRPRHRTARSRLASSPPPVSVATSRDRGASAPTTPSPPHRPIATCVPPRRFSVDASDRDRHRTARSRASLHRAGFPRRQSPPTTPSLPHRARAFLPCRSACAARS